MTADNSLFVGQLVVGNDSSRQGFLNNDGLIALQIPDQKIFYWYSIWVQPTVLLWLTVINIADDR